MKDLNSKIIKAYEIALMKQDNEYDLRTAFEIMILNSLKDETDKVFSILTDSFAEIEPEVKEMINKSSRGKTTLDLAFSDLLSEQINTILDSMERLYGDTINPLVNAYKQQQDSSKAAVKLHEKFLEISTNHEKNINDTNISDSLHEVGTKIANLFRSSKTTTIQAKQEYKKSIAVLEKLFNIEDLLLIKSIKQFNTLLTLESHSKVENLKEKFTEEFDDKSKDLIKEVNSQRGIINATDYTKLNSEDSDLNETLKNLNKKSSIEHSQIEKILSDMRNFIKQFALSNFKRSKGLEKELFLKDEQTPLTKEEESQLKKKIESVLTYVISQTTFASTQYEEAFKAVLVKNAVQNMQLSEDEKSILKGALKAYEQSTNNPNEFFKNFLYVNSNQINTNLSNKDQKLIESKTNKLFKILKSTCNDKNSIPDLTQHQEALCTLIQELFTDLELLRNRSSSIDSSISTASSEEELSTPKTRIELIDTIEKVFKESLKHSSDYNEQEKAFYNSLNNLKIHVPQGKIALFSIHNLLNVADNTSLKSLMKVDEESTLGIKTFIDSYCKVYNLPLGIRNSEDLQGILQREYDRIPEQETEKKKNFCDNLSIILGLKSEEFEGIFGALSSEKSLKNHLVNGEINILCKEKLQIPIVKNHFMSVSF